MNKNLLMAGLKIITWFFPRERLKGITQYCVCVVIVGCMSFAAATACGNTWKWSKYGIPKSKLSSCIPVRAEPLKWWPDYHKAMLEREPKNMKVMFLGDSITMYWQKTLKIENGQKVWDKYYRDLPAGNYGISGDKTENVLWRLTEGGDLTGVKTPMIVLLVGINNLYQGDSPENTAEGIKTIVNLLRRRLPLSKIMLLGIFPSRQSPTDPIREKIKIVNLIIKKLADDGNVNFLDIGRVFLEDDGSISREILRDYIHLSAKGYACWAEAMNPHLFKLLKSEVRRNREKSPALIRIGK